ncbi:hypothetical protein T12_9141 [Trichinella patagoniensis]|uniref:Uncharacterized protein n=1 Tax=Trichinella patagoniensis TaxID=990121 RepID=A0A0V1ADG0_9BILA|nr:hypothetical protein T12_9141 [Trichinella patagoniensis]
MPSGKRETERKGNTPVNTGPSPNSDGRANNLVEEADEPARGSGPLQLETITRIHPFHTVHSHLPDERTSGKFVLEHPQGRCGVEPDDSTNKVRQSPSSRRDVQRQAILRHVQHQPRTVDVIHSEDRNLRSANVKLSGMCQCEVHHQLFSTSLTVLKLQTT